MLKCICKVVIQEYLKYQVIRKLFLRKKKKKIHNKLISEYSENSLESVFNHVDLGFLGLFVCFLFFFPTQSFCLYNSLQYVILELKPVVILSPFQ